MNFHSYPVGKSLASVPYPFNSLHSVDAGVFLGPSFKHTQVKLAL
jgi:hypothetical protein